jgi:hypothetical protein
MHSWKSVQAQLAKAHTTFLQVGALLPPQRREQSGVCGHWSPKQVAAHLAGWDHEAARALRVLAAEGPQDLVADIDTFNRASVAARAHLSWQGTCVGLHMAHESLQGAIDAIVRARLPAPGYLEWMSRRVADYALHTEQLRAWIAGAEVASR